MPYSLTDLPHKTRDYPEISRRAFVKAYNSFSNAHSKDETGAHKVAWSALKKTLKSRGLAKLAQVQKTGLAKLADLSQDLSTVAGGTLALSRIPPPKLKRSRAGLGGLSAACAGSAIASHGKKTGLAKLFMEKKAGPIANLILEETKKKLGLANKPKFKKVMMTTYLRKHAGEYSAQNSLAILSATGLGAGATHFGRKTKPDFFKILAGHRKVKSFKDIKANEKAARRLKVKRAITDKITIPANKIFGIGNFDKLKTIQSYRTTQINELAKKIKTGQSLNLNSLKKIKSNINRRSLRLARNVGLSGLLGVAGLAALSKVKFKGFDNDTKITF